MFTAYGNCVPLSRNISQSVSSLAQLCLTLFNPMDCSMPGLAVPHHLLQFAKIMPFASVVLEKTPESPLDSMEIKPDNLKGNQAWILIGRADAEAEAPILWTLDIKTHWKMPWCWERLKTEGEAGNRGWAGWMPSPIQWTWTWANSGRWWQTGKAGVLQYMGSWRVGHNLATEQQ